MNTHIEKPDNGELEKGKSHIIVEIVEYVPNSVLSRTLLKKTTGNITAASFAEGEELEERTSPFDIFIQIIDGTAQITISKVKYTLSLGKGIVIPAHATHRFSADERFKMIATVIKDGYED